MKKLGRISLKVPAIVLSVALATAIVPITAMTSRADTVDDTTKTVMGYYYDDASALLSMHEDELPANMVAALEGARDNAFRTFDSDELSDWVAASSNLRVELEVAEAYLAGVPSDTNRAPDHIIGTAGYYSVYGINGISNQNAGTIAALYSTNRNIPPEMIRTRVINHFVDDIYMDILNRGADQAGRDYLTGKILDGTYTAADAVNYLLNSGEFQARNLSNDAYITVLYNVYFDRTPDAQGLSNWVNALNNGASRQQIADTFAGTQGFAQLCAYYGINK